MKQLKQIFLVFALMMIMVNAGWGQWNYDFGTGTGTHTSSTASTTFLPAPASGTARVRVGTNPGSISMVNPGLASLGTNTELQITSNTGSTSTTKFSIYDYTSGKTGYVKFKIAFAGGTNGVYKFSLGDGAAFSDNNAMATAQIFSGIEWTLGATNTISYKVLNGATFGTTGISNPTTLFVQSTSTVYQVEVFANNNTTSSNYTRSGTTYSLAASTWDLWVDGVLVGNDLAKGGLEGNVNFDSYAFNHQISATTPGTLYLDDIEYSNSLPSGNTAPTLTADVTNNNVDNNIDITFTDDATWRGLVTAVKIGGTALTLTTDYVITAGNLQLKPSGLNTLLTTSGSKEVTVEATGYTIASVTQVINPGADNNLLITTQPTAPSFNGGTLGTQPILIIRDQYNNTTTSTADVVASVGSGTWTMGGTTTKAGVSGTATFTNLTATSVGAVTGAISFTCGSLTVVTSNTFDIPAPVALGWQITAPNTLFTIDFDNTVSGVNNGQFAGSGFQSTPTAGQLNSNAWAVTGWSDGDLAFGGTRTVSSDYTRGTSTGGVSTGGIYAFTVSTGNKTLGFQPGGSDWAPGTATLKFQNSSGADVTSLLISYKVYIRNDQGRSNNFNFSHSSDNSTYSSVTNLDLTSIELADGSPTWKTYIRTVNITGLTITNGGFYYLRWSGDDVSGLGSRDEFALDDIHLVANSTSIVPTLVGTIEDAVIDGITNLSGDATINSSLNLISNTLSIGANTLTLNGTSTSTSGTLTGGTTSNLTIGGTGALGTLNFTGGSEILNNLTINRTSPGSIAFGSNLNVQGTLDLSSGIINMGANTLTLGTSIGSLGALTPATPTSLSYIVGNFERWIPNTTFTDMYFPVGSSGQYRPAIISYTTASSGGKLKVSGNDTDPGTINSNTSITEAVTNYVIDRYSQEAWWKLLTSDITGGVYDISLEANVIVGVSVTNFDRLRILKRTNNSSEWTLVGDHSPATGSNTHPFVKRIGLTGFSEFGIGGYSVDGNVLNDAPLPVTLSSLNSSIINRNIKLNWVTASENNNAGFEVERAEVRSQNLEFSKIGFISGHGTVNTPTNYSFEDKNLQTGKYKYRLKQIDHNGNYEYFELNGEVEIGVPKKYDLSQNYPNPFNPVTKINFDLPVDSKVTMLIYDITGREVAKLLNGEFKKAGYHTTNFNGSSLSSGVYFYSLSTDAFRMTKKMVLVK